MFVLLAVELISKSASVLVKAFRESMHGPHQPFPASLMVPLKAKIRTPSWQKLLVLILLDDMREIINLLRRQGG